MQEQKRTEWAWNPTDKFEITGSLLQEMIYLVQATMAEPRVQLAMRVDEQLGQIVNKGIQDGIIKDKREFDKSLGSNLIPTDLNHYSILLSEKDDEAFKNITGFDQYDRNNNDEKLFSKSYSLPAYEEYVVIDGCWIPKQEKQILDELKSQNLGTKLSFGYIDGRVHHLNYDSPQPSASTSNHYDMWVEIYK